MSLKQTVINKDILCKPQGNHKRKKMSIEVLLRNRERNQSIPIHKIKKKKTNKEINKRNAKYKL